MNLNDYIEYSVLRPTTTTKYIIEGCNIAIEHEYHAIVVPPTYVSTAKKIVANTDVKLVSTVDFPHGNSLISTRLDGVESIIDMGADEIDIVAPISKILGYHNWREIYSDLYDVVNFVQDVPIKVIIETGYLDVYEIVTMTEICIGVGAKFVKTCTGFGPKGVTIEDIRLIKSTAKNRIKIKASGGILTYQQAIDLIEAGADRIGTSKAL